MEILDRIKQLVFQGHVEFTRKADEEMELDGLEPDEVLESILNARRVDKVLRSRSPFRRHAHEKVYVIKSHSFGGTLIYTKGAIVRQEGEEVFYILISAKVSSQQA